MVFFRPHCVSVMAVPCPFRIAGEHVCRRFALIGFHVPEHFFELLRRHLFAPQQRLQGVDEQEPNCLKLGERGDCLGAAVFPDGGQQYIPNPLTEPLAATLCNLFDLGVLRLGQLCARCLVTADAGGPMKRVRWRNLVRASHLKAPFRR